MNGCVGGVFGREFAPRAAPLMESSGDSRSRPASLTCFQSELLHHLQKLPMHVLPFTQPQLRQKILLARFAKLAPRNFRLQPLDEIPEFEPAEKIGIGVEPLRVSQVGFLLSFLMSGFIFPVANIPAAIRWITNIVPARYYIEVTRDAFVRGGGWASIWHAPVVLSLLALFFFFNAWRTMRHMQVNA